MDILFRTRKLEKDCNDQRLLVRHYGDRRARVIQRRLDELAAAENLSIMDTLKYTRCHELIGDRDGQLSVDLDHPYRLIFRPANDPIPKRDDGGLDWTMVTAVEILKVEDPHGK